MSCPLQDATTALTVTEIEWFLPEVVLPLISRNPLLRRSRFLER
jgi:hypothetical protein